MLTQPQKGAMMGGGEKIQIQSHEPQTNVNWGNISCTLAPSVAELPDSDIYSESHTVLGVTGDTKYMAIVEGVLKLAPSTLTSSVVQNDDGDADAELHTLFLPTEGSGSSGGIVLSAIMMNSCVLV